MHAHKNVVNMVQFPITNVICTIEYDWQWKTLFFQCYQAQQRWDADNEDSSYAFMKCKGYKSLCTICFYCKLKIVLNKSG